MRPECPELKKPLSERSRKTLVKINLINEYQVDSEEEELISELDFESENSSVLVQMIVKQKKKKFV